MQWLAIVLNVLVLIGVFCVGMLVRVSKAYSDEKGKNLATREDISAITRAVESIRAEYAERTQALAHENAVLRDAEQRRHQLSLAALDKRLEAHQKAFSIWRQILHYAHEKDSFQFFKDSEHWWENNCLYLSADAASAFRKSMNAGYVHKGLQGAALEENWRTVELAGDVITKAVQLPGLGTATIQSATNKESMANDTTLQRSAENGRH